MSRYQNSTFDNYCTGGLITKTSCHLSSDYLKLDHTSIVSSRLSRAMTCDLSYDYRKLVFSRTVMEAVLFLSLILIAFLVFYISILTVFISTNWFPQKVVVPLTWFLCLCAHAFERYVCENKSCKRAELTGWLVINRWFSDGHPSMY